MSHLIMLNPFLQNPVMRIQYLFVLVVLSFPLCAQDAPRRLHAKLIDY